LPRGRQQGEKKKKRKGKKEKGAGRAPLVSSLPRDPPGGGREKKRARPSWVRGDGPNRAARLPRFRLAPEGRKKITLDLRKKKKERRAALINLKRGERAGRHRPSIHLYISILVQVPWEKKGKRKGGGSIFLLLPRHAEKRKELSPTKMKIIDPRARGVCLRDREEEERKKKKDERRAATSPPPLQ